MNAQLALSLRLASAAVPVLILGSASARAQAYPSKPIRMIVPFAAGGILDIMARAVGERHSSSLGQSWSSPIPSVTVAAISARANLTP